jgi:hypothetical protein
MISICKRGEGSSCTVAPAEEEEEEEEEEEDIFSNKEML